MQKPNPRTKIDTSGRNMLRNEKRERILGLAIAAGSMVSTPAENNVIIEFNSNCGDDIFQWETRLIKETDWIKGRIVSIDTFKRAIYRDSRKLRIYYKWLYCGKNYKSLKKVIKYMYSPLFISFMIIHKGYLNDGVLHISLLDFDKQSTYDLHNWFKDLYNIVTAIECESKLLIFTKKDTIYLLELCQSIISQFPTMQQRYYKKLREEPYG